jgi:hypothetical protein
MADDQYSASALRRRNQSAPDDQLSASQLRARQGIQGNTWSSSEQGVLTPSVIAFLVVAAVIAIVAVKKFIL